MTEFDFTNLEVQDVPFPSPAEEWAETCARPTALYRLYDADGALLYVGITCDLDQRWKAHARKPWWPQVADKQVQWYDNRAQAGKAEVHAIVTEEPRHNIAWRSRRYAHIYRFGWLRERLLEEEEAIRTPRRTPRSKRGKEALENLLQRREVVEAHTPGHPWRWDGRNLTAYSYTRDCAPAGIKEFLEWSRERSKYAVIDTRRWYGCNVWPAEALWLETRRRWGECPTCVGEQAPCAVVREIAARYRDHPQYCM